jgi:hypothetical protein
MTVVGPAFSPLPSHPHSLPSCSYTLRCYPLCLAYIPHHLRSSVSCSHSLNVVLKYNEHPENGPGSLECSWVVRDIALRLYVQYLGDVVELFSYVYAGKKEGTSIRTFRSRARF